MPNHNEKLLEQLTGVDSSKLNYYVELKKRTEEVLKQNSRLEILHQLTRDINIDMSIADIIERAFAKLPQALPCDFLGMITVQGKKLSLRAMMPRNFWDVSHFPVSSPSMEVIRSRKAAIFDCTSRRLAHVRQNPAYPDRLKTLAVAPMLERGKAVGSLLVGSVTEAAYSEAELNFVQHLADQLTISIHNARLYNQVSRAKKEWEETFKAVTDPIFLIDTDYNMLLHNDRLPPELLHSWQHALSEKCFAKIQGFDAPCAECPMEEIKRSGQPVFHRIQTQQGLLLDLSFYPVWNDDNQLAAVTVFMKDVTHKIKMEAQLVQSAKLAALGEMAAGVAHELNNPMTVIIGTSQMLQRELLERSPEQAEVLDDITTCGLRCKRIIQNLLTFSRQDQAPIADTDLNQEVERVLSLIKYQINRNQIEIVRNLDPNLPKMTVNGPQIQQVLTNFLVNARDTLAEVDRPTKTIEVRSSLRREGAQRWAILSVSDNGKGIEKENLVKIFTPFYTSKEATRGTGLGLSVSLGIAESHHGTIEVSSQPGKGSTFSLVLPIETD